MVLLIFYISLALVVSFLCSIMEAVLLSITPSFVAKLEAEEGHQGIRLADLKRNVDRPLAAILSLNTIAHTVGAAGAGAQATVVFGNAYVGVASAVLTFLILVVSEIIPKTLGALHWRSLAIPVTRILYPTILLMWPLVKMAEGISRMISRGEKGITMGRDEFHALAEYGVREGVLLESESRLLANVLRFGDLSAGDIMTPRTVMFALAREQSVADVLSENSEMPFSRIPLIDKNKDRITGFVLKTDVLMTVANDLHDVQLKSLEQPIVSVPTTMHLHDLFQLLIQARMHIAIVVDEFGGTAGLVTLEDVVESLLGLEIIDEEDTVEDMQRLAKENWRKRRKRFEKEHGGSG
ncbi:MAG: HlyC/CorC family transporter [Rhodothermales bacterium]|nr:HlyC/CorC family transporter [Rhodothermales bacterium]